MVNPYPCQGYGFSTGKGRGEHAVTHRLPVLITKDTLVEMISCSVFYLNQVDWNELYPQLVLLGLSRRFLLIFKYCTNKSENLHGGRSHQKVVRASAKLKNPISYFRVI
jgi:hypothetical protein